MPRRPARAWSAGAEGSGQPLLQQVHGVVVLAGQVGGLRPARSRHSGLRQQPLAAAGYPPAVSSAARSQCRLRLRVAPDPLGGPARAATMAVNAPASGAPACLPVVGQPGRSKPARRRPGVLAHGFGGVAGVRSASATSDSAVA